MLISVFAVIIFIVFLAPLAYGRDNGQWGHDPATSQWFKSLKNGNGTPCCDYADGTRIEAPDYKENVDGSYEVNSDGVWHHIDQSRVVRPAERKVSYAILWRMPSEPRTIWCFLPGSDL
jgi:hypothetical protein